MKDNIPDALIAAFERQYDTSWSDPQLRNERMAYRYGWAAAMEQKQCLVQISEPAAQPLTRYCPECGHIGEVGAAHRDCCPDGSQAFAVPEKHAEGLRTGFLAQIAQATQGGG